MRSKHWCGYCGKNHANLCDQAIEGVRRVNDIMASIEAMIKRPNGKPQTSNQMRLRADRLRDMATGIKLTGGQVREDYRWKN